MSEPTFVKKAFDYLHTIPETGFNEYKTSAYIEKELKKFGYEVVSGIGGTGVIAKMDSGAGGPVLAVRADMDAMAYEIDGEMVVRHTCGHDANSSMVLATAKKISETGIKKGKVVFIFQPDEEFGGGAIKMAESGYLDEIEEIVSIHLSLSNEAKLGEATPAQCHGTSSGLLVKVKGLTAHGGSPQLGVNAVDAAMLAIQAAYNVRMDPRAPHSIKATQFNTYTQSYNIIPDEVDLVFDMRTNTNALMEDYVDKVKETITKSVEAIGATAIVEVDPTVGNEPAANFSSEMIQAARKAIEKVLGKSLDPIFSPAGEDFHQYTRILGAKSTYIGLGADLTPALHHPEMTFDHKALEYGRDILVTVIEDRLG